RPKLMPSSRSRLRAVRGKGDEEGGAGASAPKSLGGGGAGGAPPGGAAGGASLSANAAYHSHPPHATSEPQCWHSHYATETRCPDVAGRQAGPASKEAPSTEAERTRGT